MPAAIAAGDIVKIIKNKFRVGNAYGTELHSVITDSGAGTEDVDLELHQMVNGVLTKVMKFDADGVLEISKQIQMQNGYSFLADPGTAALPGVAFVGKPDTGINWTSGNILEICAGGQAIIYARTDGVQLEKRALVDAAVTAEATPGYSFQGDQDSGMHAASDILYLVTGGTARLKLENDKVNALQPLLQVGMNVALSSSIIHHDDSNAEGSVGGWVQNRNTTPAATPELSPGGTPSGDITITRDTSAGQRYSGTAGFNIAKANGNNNQGEMVELPGLVPDYGLQGGPAQLTCWVKTNSTYVNEALQFFIRYNTSGRVEPLLTMDNNQGKIYSTPTHGSRFSGLAHIPQGEVDVDIIVHVAGTTTANFEVYLDKVELGPLDTVVYNDGPVGEIIALGGTTTPDGFLYCDGTSYLRAEYSDLFDVIGTAYGAVDGTHFNVPDLRGEFLRGQADGQATDPNRATRTAKKTGGATGDNVGSAQADATAPNGLATVSNGAHTHSINDPGHVHNPKTDTNGGGSAGGFAYSTTDGASIINASTTLNTNIAYTGISTVSNGAHTHTVTGDSETRPTNIYVRYYIRYTSNRANMSVHQADLRTTVARVKGAVSDNIETAVGHWLCFTTKDYDDHNTITLGSAHQSGTYPGTATYFTAPRGGKLKVRAFVSLNDTTNFSGTELAQLQAYNQDTAEAIIMDEYRPASGEDYPPLSGAVTINVNAGDRIGIYVYQACGADIPIQTAATRAWAEFEYVQDFSVFSTFGQGLATKQVYTGNNTWTKPAGLRAVVVEVLGGGGAGGGAPTTVAGQVACGSGGSGGGYAKKLILASALGATETITVGGGGTGSAGANGGAGSDSSFGTHCTGKGGNGGFAAGPNSSVNNRGVPGVIGTGGDINLAGGPGGNCAGYSGVFSIGGQGGTAGGIGGGGAGGTLANLAGLGATSYGGGGGGAAAGASAGNYSGGNGYAGVVIVWEYY